MQALYHIRAHFDGCIGPTVTKSLFHWEERGIRSVNIMSTPTLEVATRRPGVGPACKPD